MFVSFFPNPRLFFPSAAIWALIAVLAWFFFFKGFGATIGLSGGDLPNGVARFISPSFIWFYIYYFAVVAIFAGFWWFYSPHPWFVWSVLGAALIIFNTYFDVEIDVGINAWYGPFYDLIQASTNKTRPTPMEEYLAQISIFLGLALVAVTVGVLNRFLVQHFNFRWRTAMNTYFTENWDKLHKVEGASQRVQEDLQQFSGTLENLGVNLIGSVMTLIAFLPVLHGLEHLIPELPIIGAIPFPLVTAAIFWSIFGTGLMALAGFKLPGLNFANQRVEAAYRKELVFGENDPGRITPPSVAQLFGGVRRNFFRMYFHTLYFNIVRIFYLQIDAIFSLLVLLVALVKQVISLGQMTQIQSAFGQVSSSFKFLINVWPTLVSLMSVYRRLRVFEKAMSGEDIVAADTAYGQKFE